MLAGKYSRLMDYPAAAAAIGGGLAAGASALGNIDSDKPLERTAVEALGAGALGAAVGGLALPRVNAIAKTRAQAAGRNLGDVLNNVQSPMSARERKDANTRAQFIRDMNIPVEEAAEMLAAGTRGLQALTNASAATGGLLAAGAIGGQLGGGAANLMGIDPENPGSSNTMSARYSMQGYV